MGRAAVQLKVGCSESASDLLEASDLVTSATVAGLASTLALIVPCARKIEIMCSLPYIISVVLACCLYTLCSTLAKNCYHPRKIAIVCSLAHAFVINITCALYALIRNTCNTKSIADL